MTTRRALLMFLLAAACESSSRQPAPARTPIETAPVVPAAGAPPPYDWLPADTALIERQPAPGSFATWLRSWEPRLPSCEELIVRIDTVIRFSRDLVEDRVTAVHFAGAMLTLAELSACAAEFAPLDKSSIQVTQQGSFIAIEKPEPRGLHVHALAFSGGWLLVHPDKKRLDAVATRSTRLDGSAAIVLLLDRVKDDPGHWIVSTLDVTSRALGVPSRGFVMRLSPPGKIGDWSVARDLHELGAEGHDSAPTEVLFASHDDAVAAHTAFRERPPTFAAIVNDALQATRPAVHGAEIHFDAAPVLREPFAMEALVPAITGK